MRRFGPALEERDFRLWWLALLGMGISLQMIEVAIGWEVYALRRSPLEDVRPPEAIRLAAPA